MPEMKDQQLATNFAKKGGNKILNDVWLPVCRPRLRLTRSYRNFAAKINPAT
jgi:hypothetical protein